MRHTEILKRQAKNVARFWESAVKTRLVKEIDLPRGLANNMQRTEVQEQFEMLQDSLKQHVIVIKSTFSPAIHDMKLSWTTDQ